MKVEVRRPTQLITTRDQYIQFIMELMKEKQNIESITIKKGDQGAKHIMVPCGRDVYGPRQDYSYGIGIKHISIPEEYSAIGCTLNYFYFNYPDSYSFNLSW